MSSSTTSRAARSDAINAGAEVSPSTAEPAQRRPLSIEAQLSLSVAELAREDLLDDDAVNRCSGSADLASKNDALPRVRGVRLLDDADLAGAANRGKCSAADRELGLVALSQVHSLEDTKPSFWDTH